MRTDVTGQDVVDEARRWLGTPFHHQGRVLGRGVDCAGVVAKVAHALELSEFDTLNYSRNPNGGEMERILAEHMDRVALDERRAGDVLHFAFDADPQHLGILTAENTIVHAFALQPRKVVEHPLDAVWLARVRGVYRYRGLV